MKIKDAIHEVERAIEKEKYSLVIPIAEELIRAGPDYDFSGYMFRGWAYEHGGDGVVADLNKAVADYRHLIVKTRSAISYQYLARALMKLGKEKYDEARQHLDNGYEISQIPELDLGYAEYFRSKPNPDYESAKKHYFRAALKGRFMGFFGLSEVLKLENRNVSAMVVSCLRVCVGPFLAILLGERARHRF